MATDPLTDAMVTLTAALTEAEAAAAVADREEQALRLALTESTIDGPSAWNVERQARRARERADSARARARVYGRALKMLRRLGAVAV